MDEKTHIFYTIQIGRRVTSKLIGACSDGQRGDRSITLITKPTKIIVLTAYDM